MFSDAYSHWLHLFDRGAPPSKQFEAAVTSGGSFCPRESCWSSMAGRRPQSSLGPHRAISCLQLFHFSNWMQTLWKGGIAENGQKFAATYTVQILKISLIGKNVILQIYLSLNNGSKKCKEVVYFDQPGYLKSSLYGDEKCGLGQIWKQPFSCIFVAYAFYCSIICF